MENLQSYVELQTNKKDVIRKNYSNLLLEGLSEGDAKTEAMKRYERDIANVLFANELN